MTDFAAWLNQKLIDKGWKPADLARAGNIDSGYISRMLSGEKIPGYLTSQKLARVLGVPEDEVLFAAGKKRPATDHDETAETITYQLSRLPRAIREQVADFVNYLYERHAKSDADETSQSGRH